MANNGTKNSNDSQFFITLDRADELHGKHTLFGRVVGDTIFNVLKIGELELGADELPLYPPKIKTIRIISNPYDDIIPRITAAEKRAQQLAREQAMKEREDAQRAKGGKKNVKLLSFGGDEMADDDDGPALPRKKAIVRPDLVENPDAVPIPAPAPARPAPPKAKDPPKKAPTAPQAESSSKSAVDLASIRTKHAQEQSAESKARQVEIEKMEADIRKIARRRAGSGSEDDEPAKKKAKGPSYLEQELSKYSKGRAASRKNAKRKDESDVLAALESFRGKLQTLAPEPTDQEQLEAREEGEAEPAGQGEEEAGLEVDDDLGWLGHALHFPKDNAEVGKAERDYEVIDPRMRSARAQEEAREKRRQQKASVGQAFRRR